MTKKMKLYYQTHSPYARKSLVFAHEVGIDDELDVIHQETSPLNINPDIYAINPLGAVPVLVKQDGTNIVDSTVICLYFDTLHKQNKLIPEDTASKITALELNAIADGISLAGILARWENNRRPDKLRYPALYEGHLHKLSSSFDYLETSSVLFADMNIGHIALATSLSWIDFRQIADIRSNRPNLTKWFDDFSHRVSMKATPLYGDTHD